MLSSPICLWSCLPELELKRAQYSLVVLALARLAAKMEATLAAAEEMVLVFAVLAVREAALSVSCCAADADCADCTDCEEVSPSAGSSGPWLCW